MSGCKEFTALEEMRINRIIEDIEKRCYNDKDIMRTNLPKMIRLTAVALKGKVGKSDLMLKKVAMIRLLDGLLQQRLDF